MPRGRATVYTGTCSECGMRVASVRIMKARKADFRKDYAKYCPTCRKRQVMKVKEEKHSS